jgi:hypothetical protein
MTRFHNATIRTAELQAVVTEAGPDAIGRAYNGTQPSGGSAVGGGNTLLFEVTFDDPLGSVSAGVLTFGTVIGDTSANASGTPTFIDIFQDDGTTLVARYPMSGFPAVTSGQPVDITGFTVTSCNTGA